MIRILLFSGPDEAPALRSALELAGALVEVVSDPDLAIGKSFAGLVIEVKASMRCRDKEKLRLLEKIYPAIRVRKDAEHFRILPVYPDVRNLRDFILLCSQAQPRPVRTHGRAPVHLPAIISKTSGFKSPERSVTMNLSQGGAFVFSGRHWEEGQTLWVIFPCFEDTAAIQSEVRWTSPWNKGHSPGVGIQFRTLSQQQQEEIIQKISGKPSPESLVVNI